MHQGIHFHTACPGCEIAEQEKMDELDKQPRQSGAILICPHCHGCCCRGDSCSTFCECGYWAKLHEHQALCQGCEKCKPINIS